MIENEDSVVTSLNELRKLKNERIGRQSQSRSVSHGNRSAALAEDPLADQLTPPPVQGIAAVVAAHAPAPVERSPAFAMPAASRFESVPMQAPPVIQTKTSYKAAIVMTVLLAGAGAAGYMKLQQDTQAVIAAKDAAIKGSEDARMRSVEAAAKADALARTNLRQCEDKLKASVAAAAVVPSTPPPAEVAPVAEKKPAVAAKPTRASRRAAAHASRSSGSAASAREPREPREPKEKSGDVPTIAKKKKIDNDPLSGLGKL